MQKGFHALAIIAAIVWFALNGLLWYAAQRSSLVARLRDFGSDFFYGFYFYLMWCDEVRWNRDDKF